jgi:ferredoxin
MKLLFYSFLLLLAPCNQSKNISSTKTADNSKVTIIYECGACFGRCPEYRLTINGENKTCNFQGTKNTDKIGSFTKSISDTELNNFVSSFENAKFNSLENEYLGNITDFPIKVITYKNNGKTKTIKERSGAPEVLTSLEKTLKEYAENNEGWEKAGDSDH